MDLTYPTGQQPSVSGIPMSRVSLHEVFILYRKQFARWFGVTAPSSLLAAVVLLMADGKIRAIYSGIPRGEIQYHSGEVAEAFVVRFGSFFVSWLLGCFTLAAITTIVSGLDVGEGDEVWISDSQQRAREHFGQLFVAALLTFGLFLAGMAVVSFIEVTVGRVLSPAHFMRYNFAAALAGTVIVASIVSWFGIAIPLILRDNIGAFAALKKSVRASNGYEVFLFLLIIESVVGGYVAWYATHYGFALLLPASFKYGGWYGWVVYFVAVLAAAAIEPPLFIGLSLLADAKNRARESSDARSAV
jgi:hypothetical protein